MKVLKAAKSIRRNYAVLCGRLLGVTELMVASIATLLTGRLVPKYHAEEANLDALVICPSPLLNDQLIDEACRSRYLISFVNNACLSPQFLVLQPERFFLIDPAFFCDPADRPALGKTIDTVIERIATHTSWPMSVIVPWHYRNSNNAQAMAHNPNVKVVAVPIFNSRGTWLRAKYAGFRNGILNPIYRNVLIAAIFYNIRAQHNRVFIWGAHNTWLKNVSVDMSNQVLHSLQHTETQRFGQPLLNLDGSPTRYHEYLNQLATTFEQHHVLNEFSISQGKKIINVTDDSFIDAYDRCENLDIFRSRSLSVP